MSFLMELLTGNAGRDDHDVGALEGVCQAILIGEIASDFLYSAGEMSKWNQDRKMFKMINRV